MPKENTGNHIITKISYFKKTLRIYFNDGNKISIPKSEYPNHFLYKNKSLSDSEYNLLLNSKNIDALYKYAFKLVSKNLYSEYKIREKLYQKPGANKKNVDEVVARLKDNNLINDERLLKEYVSYFNELKYGRNKIINKLLEKGIFEERINNVSFPFELEVNKAQYWLNKLELKYSNKNNASKRMSIYSSLINKGFDKEVVNSVINNIKPNIENNELSLCKKDYEKAKSRLTKKYKGKELNNKIISNLTSKGYRLKDILKVMEVH